MTQPAEPETIELAICSCDACDQLFLVSPRRGTCPTCGGGPGLTFFEFVGNSAGLTLKGAPELLPVPPSEPPAEPEVEVPPPPVEPAPAPQEPAAVAEEPSQGTALMHSAWAYLMGRLSTVDLETEFRSAGAEPEAATTAVGRLFAVRELLEQIQRLPA